MNCHISRVRALGWMALFCVGGFAIGHAEDAIQPPLPVEERTDETVDEYRVRRSLLENGPAPFLWKATWPETGAVVWLQGEPAYCAPSLYPPHPALLAALREADLVITKNAPEEGEDEEPDVGAIVDTFREFAGYMGIEMSPDLLDELAALIQKAADDTGAEASPEVSVLVMMFGVGLPFMNEEFHLPEGERLSDIVTPATREYWLAIRKWVAESFEDSEYPAASAFALDFLDRIEKMAPLRIVATFEVASEIEGRSRHEDVVSLDAWATREAENLEKTLERRRQDLLYDDLPFLDPLYRERAARLDTAAQVTELSRFLALYQVLAYQELDEGENFMLDLLRRDYAAWFADDTAYLPPDPDWDGFLKTRIVSEWRRRVFSLVYAARLKEAATEYSRILMFLPMEFLADGPDNLQQILVADGWIVSREAAP